MTDAEFDGFVDRLVPLAEIYNAPLSAAAQLLYFDALKDLPADAVIRALDACLRTCTFMPKPAEIRQRAVGGDDPETAIERAWLEYRHLARTVGGYGSPQIADGALADAIVAIFGSWEAACWTDLTPEMVASKRKEFDRVYRVMRERGDTGPRVLAGYCDRRNGNTPAGIAKGAMKLIVSEQERANAILARAIARTPVGDGDDGDSR